MRYLRHAAAAAAFGALAACSSPMGMTATTGPAASLSAADRTFVSEAAYGGLGEVALGQLAAEKGATPAVRDFGKQMVTDHGQANTELVRLATAKDVAPPTRPDPGRTAVAGMLGKLSGRQFDQQYVTQQLSDHEASLTLYKAEANGGQDPDLKAFAERTVPIIQEHIDMLKKLHTGTMAANG